MVGALWIGAMPESRWRDINEESLIGKKVETKIKRLDRKIWGPHVYDS